jgi:hypothetical protein
MSVHVVYVFSASVPVANVTGDSRNFAKVEQATTAQSTISPYGTYVVPESIDIDGLWLTPTKIELIPSSIRKFELLHFGYVAQWETFRRAVTTNHLLCHDDTARAVSFIFSFFNCRLKGHVWMSKKSYIT